MPTVLALGGDETSLFNLQDILETFGHVLVGLHSPAEVEAQLRARAFDLVLLDIEMGGLQAVALIRSLRQIRPEARIVAITAYFKEPAAFEALEAGAHCLMRKPFEIGRILRLLEESAR